MAVTSRTQLIDYALRRLGAPVLEINVDEDQLEDRVDEALQFFREYHSDAIQESYFKVQITADDVTNGYITLPDAMTIVKRVLPISNSTMASSMFSAEYQMAFNDVYMLRGGIRGGVSQYAQTMSYINLVNDMFNSLQQVRFSRHMNRLTIIDTDLIEGQWIVIDGSMIIDPDLYTDVYDDIFLKKYLTVIIKEQWGTNLKKFGGMQLPGGVTLEGQPMYDEAREERLRLEEEIRMNHEMPPDFFVG